MNTCELEQKEKTAQLVWTGFILMFFFVQAIIWIVAITLTALAILLTLGESIKYLLYG